MRHLSNWTCKVSDLANYPWLAGPGGSEIDPSGIATIQAENDSDLSLSVHRSVLFSCAQPTGRNFWHILMEFGALTRFRLRTNALKNDSDWTTCLTIPHNLDFGIFRISWQNMLSNSISDSVPYRSDGNYCYMIKRPNILHCLITIRS